MGYLIKNKKIRYAVVGLLIAALVGFIAFEAVYSYKLDHQENVEVSE